MFKGTSPCIDYDLTVVLADDSLLHFKQVKRQRGYVMVPVVEMTVYLARTKPYLFAGTYYLNCETFESEFTRWWEANGKLFKDNLAEKNAAEDQIGALPSIEKLNAGPTDFFSNTLRDAMNRIGIFVGEERK